MTYLTISEARENLRRATQLVLDAEKAYQEHVRESSDAEAVYRKQFADTFKELREAGEPVQAAEIAARGTCAKASRERDYAAGMMKLAAEKLEDARDSRRSLWRLIEWSREHDRPAPTNNGPAQQTIPENVPGERWP